MSTKRWSDPNMLLAPFRDAVADLVQALKDAGHDPRVFETYRSRERAQTLVKRGKSKARGGLSMHCYGVACDIICKRHLWSCHEHDCDYYQQLGRLAEEHGMLWGGNWDGDDIPREIREHDLPHVQGVPLDKQDEIRNATSNEERESLVREFLGVVV